VREFRFYLARHVKTIWLGAVVVALCSIAACHGGPVIDLSPKPLEADGTISGTVRGPEGTSAIEGRSVEVVNVETGERQHASTNNAGGFTFKVTPGNYRVELALQDGESLVKQPDVIHVNRSDIDAHADFVLGVARISRPRNHPPRSDDGLGSAIA
jgi:carboxypeptidase family protein